MAPPDRPAWRPSRRRRRRPEQPAAAAGQTSPGRRRSPASSTSAWGPTWRWVATEAVWRVLEQRRRRGRDLDARRQGVTAPTATTTERRRRRAGRPRSAGAPASADRGAGGRADPRRWSVRHCWRSAADSRPHRRPTPGRRCLAGARPTPTSLGGRARRRPIRTGSRRAPSASSWPAATAQSSRSAPSRLRTGGRCGRPTSTAPGSSVTAARALGRSRGRRQRLQRRADRGERVRRGHRRPTLADLHGRQLGDGRERHRSARGAERAEPRMATRVDGLDLASGQPRWSRQRRGGRPRRRSPGTGGERRRALTVDIADGHETGTLAGRGPG